MKDVFKDDSRFEKFLATEKKWKAEFRDWSGERESKARKNFKEMLKEKTSLISSYVSYTKAVFRGERN